jgi:hypothetical protein
MKPIKVAGLLVAVGTLTALLTIAAVRPSATLAQHAPLYGTSPARLSMVVVPGLRLGVDKKVHDTITPTDITAYSGQKVILTVYNYDTGMHSITAPAIKLNLMIPGATHDGVPAVTTFTFSVAKAGSYHWLCVVPCDDDAKGWAMSHANYMAGTITIRPA